MGQSRMRALCYGSQAHHDAVKLGGDEGQPCAAQRDACFTSVRCTLSHGASEQLVALVAALHFSVRKHFNCLCARTPYRHSMIIKDHQVMLNLFCYDPRYSRAPKQPA